MYAPEQAYVSYPLDTLQPAHQQWVYSEAPNDPHNDAHDHKPLPQPDAISYDVRSHDISSEGQLQSQHAAKKTSWWPWAKSAEQKAHENFAKQFNGGRSFNGHFFRRPIRDANVEEGHVNVKRPEDYGGAVDQHPETGKFIYRNKFGQLEYKYSDIAVYLSPTTYRPKRLIVQCTDNIRKNAHRMGGDWRRRKLNGDIPKVLTISEWALRPFETRTVWGKVHGTIRLLWVAVPLQLLLAWPGTTSWDDGDVSEYYTDFPGYHWHWAKYAINPLDRKPSDPTSGTKNQTLAEKVLSSRKREVRPRKLYINQPDGQWKVVENPPRTKKYIFISYAAESFKVKGVLDTERIRQMAQAATLDADLDACWMDTDCIETANGMQKDVDIYTMCDVIRAASRVVVILADDKVETAQDWGSRLWTLPEALLAHQHEIDFVADVGGKYQTTTKSLVEITSEIWDDRDDHEEAAGSTRLLAEHFSGLLTLSRLELFAAAIDAFRSKKYRAWTASDVTLAVMSLMHYRIDKNEDDSAFQSLAQLSLSNDNDSIIERMISLHPYEYQVDKLGRAVNPFYKLADPDQFSTHVWDIEPTCDVVGVGHEDNTIIIDAARVMHIRWKGFPRMVVTRDYGLGRLLATLFVTAGTWWFIQGISITVAYAPLLSSSGLSPDLILGLEYVISAIFAAAVFLSVFGPLSVRRLYGGQVLQSASNLVGFEGVMPLAKLERLMFGNANGRLNYEASSTPICAQYRHHTLRVGNEPDWVTNNQPERCPLPEGHRLFTLVDTGTLTVNIFSAERPPTVAVLTGREGGMLRAVLCSWQFENDCLYKETVIRMPSHIEDSANLKGWLKLCLMTLNQARNMERERWATQG
ncbi:hypothetical protein GGR57DRAFT_492801 [Xylariaceae sp. FL1272]|nr:hypothetical protein GGR57DRAFT_492801 [Xylariaceae sp. FL1272]